ncbi:MAG: CGNR zinc finger domain-containing protein [Candidatus Tumulicola sp.]
MAVPESNQAPERLDLLRRFINTLDYPVGPDELGSPEAASRWCKAQGLPPVSNQRELDRLRAFREALREVLFANNGPGDPSPAWEGMRPFLGAARFGAVLDGARGLALEPAGAGAERAIAMMLAIVYDALSAGTWGRLRACRKSSCRFAYFDRSRNGSRAWCSMAVCGNREKAHRRRSRERPDQPE